MTVRSAERTLDIFEAFQSEQRPMALSRVAERVGIPVSSCHGLIGTLLKRGYLYTISRTREFYPTRRLLDVANAIVEHDPFLERIRSTLMTLRDETTETVIVGKRQDDKVLYLEVVEGLHTVRYTARPGEYKPMHSSSIGKALLGCLGSDSLRDWLRSHDMPRITKNTVTNAASLSANLARYREQGYFVTEGENVPDVTAVAVALTINNEWIGVAVAGPSHRMGSRISEIGELLLVAKRDLERSAL